MNHQKPTTRLSRSDKLADRENKLKKLVEIPVQRGGMPTMIEVEKIIGNQVISALILERLVAKSINKNEKDM